MRAIVRRGIFPLSVLVFLVFGQLGSAAIDVPLTGDSVSSSVAAFNSSIEKTLDDPFVYDGDDPTLTLPAQIYNPGAVGYHGNEPDGADVVVVYTLEALTLLDGQTFALDLYGRDGANDCCAERDDNLDIELLSGGVDGTAVATFTAVAIANEAPYHLRLTYDEAAAFDTVRITGHDTDNPAGSYFTLLEIRAVVLDPIVDGDEDGLPDNWEVANGLDPSDDGRINPDNGATGDPDNDQLLNLAEYEAKTDPQDEDSDDDTLLDGAEVAGAGDRPATNPLSEDTDGDTLSDLVETNTGTVASPTDTGTDPTLADTDADGAIDPEELRRNTNPNDPGSGANLAFGKTVGYFDATGAPAAAWDGLPVTNVVDGNLSTISHALDMATENYYLELDLGEAITVGFVSLSGRGFRDGCCAERLQGVTLAILDEDRNEVYSETLDGIIEFTREVDLSASPPRGRYLQVINSAAADYGPQLGEVEVYGSSAPPVPLVFTDFAYDTVSGAVSLTWDSEVGARYTVAGTSDLKNLAEVNDGVVSGGAVTNYEFTDTDLVGQSRYYYIVKKNPPSGN